MQNPAMAQKTTPKAHHMQLVKTKPRDEACGAVHRRLCVDGYLARLESEHSKSLADARNRVENLIRPKLGAKLVSELTRDGL
jgi:hypothetical protein